MAKVIKKCQYCKKEFTVYSYRSDTAKFCSNKCRSMVIMPPRPDRTGCEPWNKGLNKNIDDRLKKISENRMGKKNWKWNNDATQRWRDKHKRELRKWRKFVFERDNYTCKRCGQKGGYLVPHHKILVKDNKKLALDINNGITLCKECHNYVHIIIRGK